VKHPDEAETRRAVYGSSFFLIAAFAPYTARKINLARGNRRSTLTLPNGIVLTYGYDNDSHINSMSYQLGTTAVGSLSYQYDPAGSRTQMGGSLAVTVRNEG
jgi:hypothetical protein